MYKVLLADDDQIVRQGISKSIAWDVYGCTLIGTVGDGQSALAFIEKTTPDLLITDIRMPRLDGLELTEIVRQKYPQTKVILMSGYDDFNYAVQALRLQVFDYVLKPVRNHTLLETICKALASLEQDREQAALLRSAANKNNNVLKIADELALKLLLGLSDEAMGLIHRLGERFTSSHGGLFEWKQWLRETVQKTFVSPSLREYGTVFLSRLEHARTQDELLQGLRAYILGSPHAGRGPNTKNRVLEQAMWYILDNLQDESLSLKQVSKAVGLSPVYLSVLFKDMAKVNFSNFIVHHRMLRATRLLRSTDLKVYEIAAQTGYGHVQHFTVMFKKCTGKSPLEYRNDGDTATVYAQYHGS